MPDPPTFGERQHPLSSKVRWHLNRWLLRHLGLLRSANWITVHDIFGAPGDTLLTAIVCRNIKQRFPRLRINCITPNPDLLELDPAISKLNGPETYICLRHGYLDLIHHRKAHENVLEDSMRSVGITTDDYRAAVYLSDTERANGMALLETGARPVAAINTRSKEPVKNWPAERWRELAGLLLRDFDVVQLGDGAELEIDSVRSFAGRLSRRQSTAVLSHARLFIGPDSFLMHAANGLGIPSVILIGGSRTAANIGYRDNINLEVQIGCGPCYIHAARGEVCAHGIECMNRISVPEVYSAALQLMKTECR